MFQEKLMPSGPEFNREEFVQQSTEKLRKFILDNYIKPDEYYAHGPEARKKSEQQRMNHEGGLQFRGEPIGYDANIKGHIALGDLQEETRKQVTAHGIGSNVPNLEHLTETERKNFALYALLQVMLTGELKGDFGSLATASNYGNVFTDAPFILLSNKGERLAEPDASGKLKITNLRTVLVNDQYESMIEDLKKRFPGVSFRTADQIDDSVFDTKNPPALWADKITETIEKELKDKK